MASTSEKPVLTQTQFYLRWNNHTNNILQVFMEQLTAENLVDVTISCEGKFIKAHKMVLSACSPYFQELFRIHEAPHPVIIMNGVRFVDVKQVVEFMYRGEIKILETELDKLLAVAESLQVKGLSNVRGKYEKGEIRNAPKPSAPAPEPDAKKRKIDLSSGIEQLFDCNTTDSDDVPLRPAATEKPQSQDNEGLIQDIKVEPPDIDEEETLDAPPFETIPDEETNVQKIKQGRIIIKGGTKTLVDGSGKFVKTLQPSTSRPVYQIKTVVNSNQPSKSTTVFSKHPANLANSKPVKIPRPPNAFMIFANKWRKTLANMHQNESNAEISCRLGNMWKGLEKEAKDGYYKAAKQADLEHKEKYPGYYYSPQEARQRKYNQQLKACETSRVETIKGNQVHFVQVYMTGKNDTSTPVMIALENPEVSVQIDKTYSLDQKEWEDDKKIDIKEEIIDSCTDEIEMKEEPDDADVESTSKEDDEEKNF